MTEKIISIASYSPLDIFGVNDKNINSIKAFFPKLKIIARGEDLKVIGDEEEINLFEKKFGLLLLSYDKFGKITDTDLEQIMKWGFMIRPGMPGEYP